jgi:hypothetical protein
MKGWNAAIENVEQSIHDQTQGNSACLEAATAIQHTRSEAVGALRRLDPVMDKLLSNDPPVRAVWQRARRIERATGVGKPVERQTPTSPAPVTA